MTPANTTLPRIISSFIFSPHTYAFDVNLVFVI